MSILQEGDFVGFAATSSGLEGRDPTPAINYFEKVLNLRVKLAPNLNKAYRYMAGTDEERAQALTRMYEDKEIKAIFTIRGAGGSFRMLSLLNYNIIKKNSKPLFGLSDVSSVQNAILSKTNNSCYTGFLPLYNINQGGINEEMAEHLKKTLFSNTHYLQSGISVIEGEAEGKIIGGCLSSFLYLAGTKYLPDFKDKILLLEDKGEKTFNVDLKFSQIKQLKNFNKLKGIILGQFTNCPIIDDFDGTIDDCIDDFVKELKIPVIKNFNYGHIQNSHIIPLGINAKMAATKKGCFLTW